MAVAAKPKKVKFISWCQNQVLCIKPSRNQIVDGIVFPVPGKHARFENGELTTDDAETIEFIKQHRLFGNHIFEDKKSAVEASE